MTCAAAACIVVCAILAAMAVVAAACGNVGDGDVSHQVSKMKSFLFDSCSCVYFFTLTYLLHYLIHVRSPVCVCVCV